MKTFAACLKTIPGMTVAALFFAIPALRAGDQSGQGNAAVNAAPVDPKQVAPSSPSPDFWQQPNFTGNWGGLRDKLHDDGFDFSMTYDHEVLGNPYGGNFGHGAIDEGLLEPGVTLDFEKMTGGAWKGATFGANAYWSYGPSLTQKYVGDISTISNIDAFDTVRLNNLWFQQNFFDHKISLEVGQLSVDAEFFTSTTCQLFLNGTFGAFPLVTYNFAPNNPPIFPFGSTGARLKVQPVDSFYVMTAVYNGNAGTESGSNKYGTRFGFSADTGFISFSELGYLLNQGENDKGLPGTYKLGGWVDTANFATWSSQAAYANGTGPIQSAGVGYGIYGVADQTVWKKEASAGVEPQSLSVCLRAGAAPSCSSEIDFDIDGAVNFTGLIPGRKDDVLGVGLSRSAISRDYSNFSQATGGPAFQYESVIEGIYSLNLAPWWQVQPDLQYVFSAGGTTQSPDALVVGIRSTVTF